MKDKDSVSENSSEDLANAHQEEKTPGCYIKARLVLAFMGFFGMFNVYTMRTNLSIAIVAMVNSTSDDEQSNSSCPDRGVSEINDVSNNGVFNWDRTQQGLILGCYFYGYIFSNIPGGWMAKRYGVRLVLGVSMLCSSVLTLLSPVIANTSFALFVTFRILLGFLQGVSFPSMHSAWSRWAPPMERSSLISFHMSGSSFGTVISLPIAGVIADNLGWEAVFYVTGAGALLWSIIWIAIIHNSPEEHPRISEQEKTYIVQTIGRHKNTSPEMKTRTPWAAMLTSLPLWGIVAGHFASNWGNYTLLTMLPTYMSDILRFNLSASGGLSALPYIMQFVFTIGGGYITDVIRRRKIMSTVAIRKLNTSLGLFIPAVSVVMAGYIGCDVAAAVVFFTISVAFNGLTVPGCKANTVDIAPKYGGITYGISNTIANISGFLAPQVVGLMLQEDDSLSQWQLVFWVAAIFYILGGIIYLVFGSGVEQPWASGKLVIRKNAVASNVIDLKTKL